jgi:hypothetical protein
MEAELLLARVMALEGPLEPEPKCGTEAEVLLV